MLTKYIYNTCTLPTEFVTHRAISLPLNKK
jgi:hypothetical protein